jgi:hypothetical protein
MTQLDIDVMGVRAELAVSIFLAVPFNDRILPGGDDGADLEYRGRSVEVKAISYRGGVLIFHSLDEFDSNFAVACFAPNRRVDILGWITRERFAEIHEKRNFGKGLRVFVPQVALRDPREIEQAFRRSA